jgi:hypothetical protein
MRLFFCGFGEGRISVGINPHVPNFSDLSKSATNIPSEYTITSIVQNDAMILPNDANPGRMTFSERTGSEMSKTR